MGKSRGKCRDGREDDTGGGMKILSVGDRGAVARVRGARDGRL